MALNASQQWWIRVSGNVLNGGGFDSLVSGAGTNYADQDSPQLSLTDFATSGAGSTTLTSATGGFTAAMIGNAIRIASGTNFQTGYYVVTAYTDTNTVTVDRTPTSGGAGSGGTGRLGGAFAMPGPSLSTTATITSPLAAGHTINIRGAGTDNPSTVDYTQATYQQYAAGNQTAGYIRWVGYNGRPYLETTDGYLIYNASYHSVENLKVRPGSAPSFTAGMIHGLGVSATNCIFEANGKDISGIQGVPYDCSFINSGSTTAGIYYAISLHSYAGYCSGNFIKNWRGGGITSNGAVMGNIHHNLIIGCKGTTPSAILSTGAAATYNVTIVNNTIYNCAGDAIRCAASTDIQVTQIMNNIIANNTGAGVNYAVNTAAVNDRMVRIRSNRNCYYGNGNTILNGSLGPNDVTLDPQFVATGSDNFAIGTNLKALGFPGAFRGSGTTGYLDLGAVQRQETGGSSQSASGFIF